MAYILETSYEALFDEDINAASVPTTTNFAAIALYFTYLLNSKLGISANITDTTIAGVCALWVGMLIKEFAAYNKVSKGYVSPEKFAATPNFLAKMAVLEPLVTTIRNNLTTEDDPAYYQDMYGIGSTGGGSELV